MILILFSATQSPQLSTFTFTMSSLEELPPPLRARISAQRFPPPQFLGSNPHDMDPDLGYDPHSRHLSHFPVPIPILAKHGIADDSECFTDLEDFVLTKELRDEFELDDDFEEIEGLSREVLESHLQLRSLSNSALTFLNANRVLYTIQLALLNATRYAKRISQSLMFSVHRNKRTVWHAESYLKLLHTMMEKEEVSQQALQEMESVVEAQAADLAQLEKERHTMVNSTLSSANSVEKLIAIKQQQEVHIDKVQKELSQVMAAVKTMARELDVARSGYAQAVIKSQLSGVLDNVAPAGALIPESEVAALRDRATALRAELSELVETQQEHKRQREAAKRVNEDNQALRIVLQKEIREMLKALDENLSEALSNTQRPALVDINSNSDLFEPSSPRLDGTSSLPLSHSSSSLELSDSIVFLAPLKKKASVLSSRKTQENIRHDLLSRTHDRMRPEGLKEFAAEVSLQLNTLPRRLGVATSSTQLEEILPQIETFLQHFQTYDLKKLNEKMEELAKRRANEVLRNPNLGEFTEPKLDVMGVSYLDKNSEKLFPKTTKNNTQSSSSQSPPPELYCKVFSSKSKCAILRSLITKMEEQERQLQKAIRRQFQTGERERHDDSMVIRVDEFDPTNTFCFFKNVRSCFPLYPSVFSVRTTSHIPPSFPFDFTILHSSKWEPVLVHHFPIKQLLYDKVVIRFPERYQSGKKGILAGEDVSVCTVSDALREVVEGLSSDQSEGSTGDEGSLLAPNSPILFFNPFDATSAAPFPKLVFFVDSPLIFERGLRVGEKQIKMEKGTGTMRNVIGMAGFVAYMEEKMMKIR